MKAVKRAVAQVADREPKTRQGRKQKLHSEQERIMPYSATVITMNRWQRATCCTLNSRAFECSRLECLDLKINQQVVILRQVIYITISYVHCLFSLLLFYSSLRSKNIQKSRSSDRQNSIPVKIL